MTDITSIPTPILKTHIAATEAHLAELRAYPASTLTAAGKERRLTDIDELQARLVVLKDELEDRA